ncbi:hypothetical protein ACHAO1_000305 [Botrytis cinerea]
MDGFSRLRELVRSSKKIVVISVAGISANADFPTFADMQKSKQTSFDRSLYSPSGEMISFHPTFRGMLWTSLGGLALIFGTIHRILIALSACYLISTPRRYASMVELIKPDVGYATGFVTTSHIYFKVPICHTVKGACKEARPERSLTIGRLRPNVLLYGEPHPDDKEILEAAKHGLRICPVLVLIVSTKLRIPGAKSIAADFCHAARSVDGASFWISKEEPALNVKSVCDYVLIKDCDEVIPLDIFKLSD